MKEITVLCKVVDNFGDIGVVWRLCRCLLKKDNSLKIHLIVDDLTAFSCIWSGVETEKSFQIVNGINVYDWKDFDFCYSEFIKNDGEKLGIILECFQCGRPDWMEKILFEEKLQRTVHVIMIDYLTAEKYAQDFHCLESLTRSKKVLKVNFMPGFTKKTGGLIIDEQWAKLSDYEGEGPVLVFTYERGWGALVRGIMQSNHKNKKILVAQGRGKQSFINAYQKIRKDNNEATLEELPYLNQNEWDKMMQKCSVLFIRGEESLSRACLSGIPFVWHAYPQSEEYQLVKVNALLERMQNHFSALEFEIIKNVWLDFNLPQSDVDEEKMLLHVTEFINAKNVLQKGFRDFAKSLIENGDLCEKLLQYIQNLEKSL